jgi:1-acyl-sn-glycerol-3-phosphate acyltransferase
MNKISKFFFLKLMGWKIKGDVPRHLDKYLIVVAPHSSNWDFIIGLFVRSILKFKSYYLAKSQLFKRPWGWLFRGLGGYPVDRNSSHNLVDQVVDLINKNNYFVLAITPEGTRKNVSRWKTGFYYIAQKSMVPLVFASIDYLKKEVEFNPPYYITGNRKEDETFVNKIYSTISGKNRKPAKFILE